MFAGFGVSVNSDNMLGLWGLALLACRQRRWELQRTHGAWEGGIWGILKSGENHGKQVSGLEPWKENKGKVDNHGKQYQVSGIEVVEAEVDGNFSGMEGVRVGF